MSQYLVGGGSRTYGFLMLSGGQLGGSLVHTSFNYRIEMAPPLFAGVVHHDIEENWQEGIQDLRSVANLVSID